MKLVLAKIEIFCRTGNEIVVSSKNYIENRNQNFRFSKNSIEI